MLVARESGGTGAPRRTGRRAEDMQKIENGEPSSPVVPLGVEEEHIRTPQRRVRLLIGFRPLLPPEIVWAESRFRPSRQG